MQATELTKLIERQRPGWSLEQPFYTSEAIYEIERRHWLAEQWYVLGHCSELSEPGSYLVRELLGESLIIVRDQEGVLRGFYNVCRHRGSRICKEDGRGSSLVCPYHAWSYRLDGSLRTARALAPGVDTDALGLHPVPVMEIGGIILGSLHGDPRRPDDIGPQVEPLLHYHGIPQARIAARRSYPTHANWKLVIENFMECYHCLSAHPEYSRVMKNIDSVGRQAPEAAQAWKEKVGTWWRQKADPASPLGPAPVALTPAGLEFLTFREPIGGDRQTQSHDGKPVAPLMGQMGRFDGGYSGFSLRPFISFIALNDYAVMFQFLPNGPQKTEVTLTWLVDGKSAETEVDMDRMTWLWDVTTKQDKHIIEDNAAGVRSMAYVPGPYSMLEPWPSGFVARYLRELSASIDAA